MAIGRATHTDGGRTFSYCSTRTIAVFVALSLVGIWMLTSSTKVPAETIFFGTKTEIKDKSSQSNSRPSVDVSVSEAQDSASQASKTNDDVAPSKTDFESEEMPENLADETKESQPIAKNQNQVDLDTEQEIQEGIRKDKNSTEIGYIEQTKTGHENELDKEEKSDVDKIQDGRSQEPLENNVEENGLMKEVFNNEGNQSKVNGRKESLPPGALLELSNETNTWNEAWRTQDLESKNEREVQTLPKGQIVIYNWKLCNVTAGADYIPCLDNEVAIRKLPSTKHYEHRERHCPEVPPTCLVPLPDGYKLPIKWPKSREKIWYNNVPHTKLVAVKGHQNWVKTSGEYLTFPGGGTQFKHGALHYIDFIQESLSDIAWGKRNRVILDVGCGVASFGAYLFERDVLTMSFAPKDEHEAQVQFALERGIPAILAVMGTKRLPFPSNVFDAIHCAQCRVPWHIEGGLLLLELNRLLCPGGYFLWSATPVYRNNNAEDVEIWEAMSALTKSMCWKMVAKKKDKINQVGLAIYRKPTDNKCYEKRVERNPPLCQESDNPDAAWNILLQACIHKLPAEPASRGTRWPELWPLRLEKVPYWLNTSQIGVYGKPAPEDFRSDYEHWKRVVIKSYVNGLRINWSTVRNVMDMRSVYGGFAAALQDMNVWVMNIVSVDAPDTLPIIYERGLFGMYHDWCESFSTYPRTYDLLHADHLFTKLKERCQLLPVLVEVDRILRPEGKLIVRDNLYTVSDIKNIARSLKWKIQAAYSEGNEGLLCFQKTMWRPTETEVA